MIPFRTPLFGDKINLDPDPYWSSVVALIGFDGTDGSASFSDDSASNHTLTAFGNAQVDTGQFQYGDASGKFDGSGDYVTLPDSSDWDFGTASLTMEGWTQFAGSGDRTIMSRNNDFTNGAQFDIGISASGNLNFSVPFRNASGSFTPSGGTWYYWCAQKVNIPGVSTNYYLHTGTAGGSATLLGSDLGNYTDNLTITDPLSLMIGRHEGHGGPTNDFNGWIDEIRITKGIARYGSGTFPVPTAPFPRGNLAFTSGVPVISSPSGFYGVGDTFNVTTSLYRGTSMPTSRQWLADGVPIPGATGTSFTATSSELGKKLSVRQMIVTPDGQVKFALSGQTPTIVTPSFQIDTRITSPGNVRIVSTGNNRVISTRIA